MRMNFQRSAKTNRRFAKLAQFHMAKTLTGCCAEVVRVARQSFPAIGDRALEILSHVAHRRALVPSLCEVGCHSYEFTKKLFRFGQPVLLHCIDAGAK